MTIWLMISYPLSMLLQKVKTTSDSITRLGDACIGSGLKLPSFPYALKSFSHQNDNPTLDLAEINPGSANHAAC